MSYKHSKKTKQFLKELKVLFVTAEVHFIAPRKGSEKDIPEGSRYIQISETLVKQIVKRLDEII